MCAVSPRPMCAQKRQGSHGSAMIVVLGLAAVFLTAGAVGEGNLSCYQCTKKTSDSCPEETLLPCPPNKDRCVTHYSKDPTNGYVMKKECGLGPCGFEDDMVNKGLGIADQCDTSRDEYFCVFCCKESGCNAAAALISHLPVLFISILSVVIFSQKRFRILA